MIDRCYLYHIYNSEANIHYVGLTKEPKTRKRDHFRESSNTLLKHYVKELGKDSFKFDILCIDTRTNIEELEELVIVEAKSLAILRKGFIVCNMLTGSVFTGASSQKGEAHWNARFTEQEIISIRSIYALGGTTQTALGKKFGCSNKVISSITRGDRWSSTAGVLSDNPTLNKVANRRKLSDAQVLTVREEAQEEFFITGTISIPSIAELYSISRHSMRLLLLGVSYPTLGGPILRMDYYLNYGK